MRSFLKTITRDCPSCKAPVKIQRGTLFSFGTEIFFTALGALSGSSLNTFGVSNEALKCETCHKELMLWMPGSLCLIAALIEGVLLICLGSEFYGWQRFTFILVAVIFLIFFNLYILSHAFQINVCNKSNK